MFTFGDLHEARVEETTVTPDSVLPIIEVVFVTDKGQFRLGRQVVMHTDQSARVTGGTRSRDFAFEDGGLESALGEVEGQAGAHHARADDDGIVGLIHIDSFLNMFKHKGYE